MPISEAKRRYMKTEKYRITQAKYRKTSKYKCYQKKYYNSPHGKEKRRLWLKGYQNSPALKAANHRFAHSPRGKFRCYKVEAKRRNLVFSLTFEQFLSFWQKDCHYCGGPIKEIGIDRVNNSSGYIMENCVPCCQTCNKAKLQMSKQDYINHCAKVYNNSFVSTEDKCPL